MRLEEFVDQNGKERIRWQCPYCSHRWDFHSGGRDCIGFLVVHHLAKKHHMDAVEIAAYDSGLEEAALEYPGLVPPSSDRQLRGKTASRDLPAVGSCLSQSKTVSESSARREYSETNWR
jgi:hypothetical protein